MPSSVQDSKGVTKLNAFKERSTGRERERSANNSKIGFYRLLYIDRFPVST